MSKKKKWSKLELKNMIEDTKTEIAVLKNLIKDKKDFLKYVQAGLRKMQ